MQSRDANRIVAEQSLDGYRFQLVEDRKGSYYFRKISEQSGHVLLDGPIHGDPSILAEAREHFPDFLPFGGLPVDAT